jgi:hypothetical protein
LGRVRDQVEWVGLIWFFRRNQVGLIYILCFFRFLIDFNLIKDHLITDRVRSGRIQIGSDQFDFLKKNRSRRISRVGSDSATTKFYIQIKGEWVISPALHVTYYFESNPMMHHFLYHEWKERRVATSQWSLASVGLSMDVHNSKIWSESVQMDLHMDF